jgi:alpha-tubulin suppressor-like RCC1 family protein
MAVRISLVPLVLLVACSAAPAAEGGAEGVESDIAEIQQDAVLPTAKFIATGDNMTCAKVAGQGVKCWGANQWGELGIGVTGGDFPAPQSIVSPGANVKGIDGGSQFSCALLKEGVVKCWGQNFSGNLGTGDTVATNAPTIAVPLPAPAREVATGALHVCARVEGGDVYCWGGNYTGSLGIGPGPDQPLPTAPVDFGGRRAKAIASGALHSCAVLGNGTVRCWGENTVGQLGDGTVTNSGVPAAPVALGAKAVAVTAGMAHTCALLETGEVKCWGNNYDGQLGLGELRFEPQPPQLVAGLPGPVTAVVTGGDHTCVLLADQRVACFGFNPLGQVGTPDYEYQHPSPVVLDIEFPVAAIDAGFDHTCALSTTGDVKCWGANWGGKLGLACYPGCMDTFGQSPSQIPNVQF